MWTVIITGAGLLLSCVVAVATATWVLARSDRKVYAKVDTDIKKIREELTSLEVRFDSRVGESLHDFGEAMAAIRQKVTDVELWSRDHLVSKHTFTSVIADLKSSWERFQDKLDGRLDRLDEKLDSLPYRKSDD